MRMIGTIFRFLTASAFLCGAASQALAQSNPNVLVSGSSHETGSFGYDFTFTFSCRGAPTCTGTYAVRERFENCANFNERSGRFVVTGLNLATSGPIQGTLTLHDIGEQVGCGYGNSSSDETLTYAGTWNLATGAASGTITGIDHEDGSTFTFPFSLTANVDAPAPVFEMTVSSNITPTTATASAQIQFRPQDLGRNASGFTFAYAPANQVRNGAAFAKDDTGCVLAQLNASGQLVAVSASQLAAFFSGVLSSQGAAVSIMNNVSTPAVAGATFYVGYGESAAAMLNEGVFRDAVTVPGSGVCPLLPMQTALWWNPRESGWGLNLNHQGNILFGTLFTYDAQRAPMWLVMSAGRMQADGRSFTGELYRTTGPAFNAVPFTPITAGNLTQVGSMTLSIADANAATLTYTVDGVQVTKSIQRQVFGPRASNCMPIAGSRASSANYQDLWWNAAESGWGINIAHQGDILFATLFTYDASGRGLWLVMSAGRKQADGSYSGELYRTSGPAFNAVPFTPIGASDLVQVGTMRLRFADGEHAQLTYTVEGVGVTKDITRQVFSSPAFACQ
jgi:hypothetical protein